MRIIIAELVLLLIPFAAFCQDRQMVQIGILSGVSGNTTLNEYPVFELGEQVGIRIKAPIKKYLNWQLKTTLRDMNFRSSELYLRSKVDGTPQILSREVVDNFQTIDFSASLGLRILRYKSFGLSVAVGAGRGTILNSEGHARDVRLFGLNPHFGFTEYGLEFQYFVSTNLVVILHTQYFNTGLHQETYGSNHSLQANINFSYAFAL